MYPILLSTLVLLKIEPLNGFLHLNDNFVTRFLSNPRRIFRRNHLIARIVLRGNAPNQLTNEFRVLTTTKTKAENKQNKNSERAADNFCQVSLPSLHD